MSKKLDDYLFLLVVMLSVNIAWPPSNVVQEGIDSNINYYAFMHLNKQSTANMLRQKSKIGKPLHIIPYISVKKSNANRSEYLKQLALLQTVSNKMDNDNAKFLSVIFEDGFVVNESGLNYKLENIVEQLDEIEYDILLLGGNQNMQGDLVKNNVYRTNINIPFTNVYGYVINNMNLDKMVPKIKNASGTSMQDKLYTLCNNRDIVVFCLYPALVTGAL